MIKHTLFKQLLAAGIILAVIVFAGCEEKTETTEQPKEEVVTKVVTPDTSSVVNEPVVEETIIIPDIKGSWTGTFDKRETTLTIPEQTDSSFSGKITINYREVINQEIKGTFSPTTMKMSMTDQLHSRYRGKYDGRLSEDSKNFSGTFTMDVDGSKFTFNLNKK